VSEQKVLQDRSELSVGSDRRAGPDRRARPTPFLSRYWLTGRRKGGRRDSERANVYVDRYSRSELALVIGVLVLSMLDMFFTLIHLQAGGTEANPIMAWTLAWGGEGAFKAVKVATTIIALAVLLIHIRFQRVRALLTFAFILYAGVLLFHFYLAHIRAAGAAF
jgi:hypothetical protein